MKDLLYFFVVKVFEIFLKTDVEFFVNISVVKLINYLHLYEILTGTSSGGAIMVSLNRILNL